MPSRSPDALIREVRLLKRRATPVQPARQWSMTLEEDEEVSEELRSQVGEHDTLFVKRIAKGCMPERPAWGQIMSCWKPGPRGLKKPHFIRQYNVDVSNV